MGSSNPMDNLTSSLRDTHTRSHRTDSRNTASISKHLLINSHIANNHTDSNRHMVSLSLASNLAMGISHNIANNLAMGSHFMGSHFMDSHCLDSPLTNRRMAPDMYV